MFSSHLFSEIVRAYFILSNFKEEEDLSEEERSYIQEVKLFMNSNDLLFGRLLNLKELFEYIIEHRSKLSTDNYKDKKERIPLASLVEKTGFVAIELIKLREEIARLDPLSRVPNYHPGYKSIKEVVDKYEVGLGILPLVYFSVIAHEAGALKNFGVIDKFSINYADLKFRLDSNTVSGIIQSGLFTSVSVVPFGNLDNCVDLHANKQVYSELVSECMRRFNNKYAKYDKFGVINYMPLIEKYSDSEIEEIISNGLVHASLGELVSFDHEDYVDIRANILEYNKLSLAFYRFIFAVKYDTTLKPSSYDSYMVDILEWINDRDSWNIVSNTYLKLFSKYFLN